MSEPYDSPFRQCCSCGENVEERDFDKATGCCKFCMQADQTNEEVC